MLRVGYSSPAELGIMKDLNLTLSEYSLFGSILTIGAMIGAIMSGRIADFLGRKAAMGVSDIFCVAGWLGIFFSEVPVYIAEITPKNLRGAFTTVHQAFIVVESLLMFQLMICIGVSLTYILGTIVRWRILSLIGIIPSMIQILGLFFIPESPRWLANAGRQKDFESALRMLRGKDADISDEVAEIRIPMTTLGVLLMDKSGRRPLLMVYTGSFSLGMGGIPWVIMSERNIVSDISGTFFMFAGVCGVTVLFVAKLVPETKNRTLEEIQASMNSFSFRRN
ncbi:hypothetical protein ACLOJK_025877 [Asimina triloba]